MFERDSSSPITSRSYRNMPVDFTSYLLSASPPGFDYYSLRDQINADLSFGGNRNKTTVNVIRSAAAAAAGESRTVNGFDVPKKHGSKEDLAELEDRINAMSFSAEVNKGMGKKKVSFADELGLALTHVKILLEPSDQPPYIRPEVLSSLTKGASAGVTEVPPLVLNFKQPASDYISFREKINQNCVCLENVILKDYNLLGTIKVKNISFEKTVRVRYTYDSWENSHDAVCHYVETPAMVANELDTFSFELSIPPNFDPSKRVEFCICYETPSQQYWDSNDGANYSILSNDWHSANKAGSEKSGDIFSINNGFGSADWTGFSAWSSLDSSVPYW